MQPAEPKRTPTAYPAPTGYIPGSTYVPPQQYVAPAPVPSEVYGGPAPIPTTWYGDPNAVVTTYPATGAPLTGRPVDDTAWHPPPPVPSEVYGGPTNAQQLPVQGTYPTPGLGAGAPMPGAQSRGDIFGRMEWGRAGALVPYYPAPAIPTSILGPSSEDMGQMWLTGDPSVTVRNGHIILANAPALPRELAQIGGLFGGQHPSLAPLPLPMPVPPQRDLDLRPPLPSLRPAGGHSEAPPESTGPGIRRQRRGA